MGHVGPTSQAETPSKLCSLGLVWERPRKTTIMKRELTLTRPSRTAIWMLVVYGVRIRAVEGSALVYWWDGHGQSLEKERPVWDEKRKNANMTPFPSYVCMFFLYPNILFRVPPWKRFHGIHGHGSQFYSYHLPLILPFLPDIWDFKFIYFYPTNLTNNLDFPIFLISGILKIWIN